MGNRYYATVTFPAAAKVIPEVAALRDLHYEISDDGATLQFIDPEANYGRMDEITDVLDEFKVPYDHEEMPGNPDEVNCTHHVRWPPAPDRVANVLVTGEDKPVVTTLDDTDYEKVSLARIWLKILDEGNLTELRRLMESTIAECYVEALDEIEWKVPV